MEHEFDCPQCGLEEAFKVTFAGSDNGLPGSYFQSFLEPDEVTQECKCQFTKEEMDSFLSECALRAEDDLRGDA